MVVESLVEIAEGKGKRTSGGGGSGVRRGGVNSAVKYITHIQLPLDLPVKLKMRGRKKE